MAIGDGGDLHKHVKVEQHHSTLSERIHHHEPREQQVARLAETSINHHISGLDSAHSAFQSASAEARKMFLDCYKDADPTTLAMLELMTGKNKPSKVLEA